MNQQQPVILGPDAKPARRSKSDRCPDCGAPADRRQASGAFGVRWPVCSICGKEFKDEVWE